MNERKSDPVEIVINVYSNMHDAFLDLYKFMSPHGKSEEGDAEVSWDVGNYDGKATLFAPEGYNNRKKMEELMQLDFSRSSFVVKNLKEMAIIKQGWENFAGVNFGQGYIEGNSFGENIFPNLQCYWKKTPDLQEFSSYKTIGFSYLAEDNSISAFSMQYQNDTEHKDCWMIMITHDADKINKFKITMFSSNKVGAQVAPELQFMKLQGNTEEKVTCASFPTRLKAEINNKQLADILGDIIGAEGHVNLEKANKVLLGLQANGTLEEEQKPPVTKALPGIYFFGPSTNRGTELFHRIGTASGFHLRPIPIGTASGFHLRSIPWWEPSTWMFIVITCWVASLAVLGGLAAQYLGIGAYIGGVLGNALSSQLGWLVGVGLGAAGGVVFSALTILFTLLMIWASTRDKGTAVVLPRTTASTAAPQPLISTSTTPFPTQKAVSSPSLSTTSNTPPNPKKYDSPYATAATNPQTSSSPTPSTKVSTSLGNY
jgi:hypothetical protein